MKQTGFEFMNNNENAEPSFGAKEPDKSLHPIYDDEGEKGRSKKSRSKVGSGNPEVEIPDVIPPNIPDAMRYRDPRNPSGD